MDFDRFDSERETFLVLYSKLNVVTVFFFLKTMATESETISSGDCLTLAGL